jgi:signal transduction histidine kinase
LGAQIGVVAALFIAALLALAVSWSTVVAREGRRASARDLLDQAGEGLAGRGRDLLRGLPEWPYPTDWERLDQQLSLRSEAALRQFPEVEGGYYVRESRRFLGASPPAAPGAPHPSVNAKPAEKTGRAGRRLSGPPPREAELIEIQVDAAIRKGQILFVVEDVPPSTVAIRTAPVAVEGRIVGATWTMIRLVDPIFLDRSLRGTRLAAGLALAGVAVSLLLTGGLTRTVRLQARERERLQVELRRSERLAALGKLLAGVAHEVRNPLAGIRSTVQLWQRGLGPDAESFADLLAEVERLDGIVVRLLHFSRAESQEFAPGDVNQVVAEAARLARGPAEEQGVTVDEDLEAGLPPVALAPPALMQVLRNLTTNSLHAMLQGGRLRLQTRHDPAHHVVRIIVDDSGPGLAPEALTHLFEPFYTTKPGGTGLGLAIAREIVLAHQGEIRATNRSDGPGAVFEISLPIVEGGPAHDRA